jgi:mycothiol system anti-sigma-R factor
MTDHNCHESLERLYEYLDGELSPEDAREVERHLQICAECYPEVRLTTDYREALRRAAQGQPCCPNTLRDRVARLIQKERHQSP